MPVFEAAVAVPIVVTAFVVPFDPPVTPDAEAMTEADELERVTAVVGMLVVRVALFRVEEMAVVASDGACPLEVPVQVSL